MSAQPVWRGCCSAAFLGHRAEKNRVGGGGVHSHKRAEQLRPCYVLQNARGERACTRGRGCDSKKTPPLRSPLGAQSAHRTGAERSSVLQKLKGTRAAEPTTEPTPARSEPPARSSRRRTGGFLFQTTCGRRGTGRQGHPAVQAEDSRGAKGWI